MWLHLIDLRGRGVVPDDVSEGPGHDVPLLGAAEPPAVGGLVTEEESVPVLQRLELAPEKTGECRSHELARGNLLKETSWEYFQLVQVSIQCDDVSVCDPLLPLQRVSDAAHILSVLHEAG